MTKTLNEKEKELLTIIKSTYDDFLFKEIETYTYEIIKDGKVIAAHTITASNKPALMKVVQKICENYVLTIQSVKEANNHLTIILKPLTEEEKQFVKVIENLYERNQATYEHEFSISKGDKEITGNWIESTNYKNIIKEIEEYAEKYKDIIKDYFIDELEDGKTKTTIILKD